MAQKKYATFLKLGLSFGSLTACASDVGSGVLENKSSDEVMEAEDQASAQALVLGTTSKILRIASPSTSHSWTLRLREPAEISFALEDLRHSPASEDELDTKLQIEVQRGARWIAAESLVQAGIENNPELYPGRISKSARFAGLLPAANYRFTVRSESRSAGHFFARAECISGPGCTPQSIFGDDLDFQEQGNLTESIDPSIGARIDLSLFHGAPERVQAMVRESLDVKASRVVAPPRRVEKIFHAIDQETVYVRVLENAQAASYYVVNYSIEGEAYGAIFERDSGQRVATIFEDKIVGAAGADGAPYIFGSDTGELHVLANIDQDGSGFDDEPRFHFRDDEIKQFFAEDLAQLSEAEAHPIVLALRSAGYRNIASKREALAFLRTRAWQDLMIYPLTYWGPTGRQRFTYVRFVDGNRECGVILRADPASVARDGLIAARIVDGQIESGYLTEPQL